MLNLKYQQQKSSKWVAASFWLADASTAWEMTSLALRSESTSKVLNRLIEGWEDVWIFDEKNMSN